MMSSLVEVEQTKASLWPNSYQIVNSVSQETIYSIAQNPLFGFL